jgi:hypothetical protein
MTTPQSRDRSRTPCDSVCSTHETLPSQRNSAVSKRVLCAARASQTTALPFAGPERGLLTQWPVPNTYPAALVADATFQKGGFSGQIPLLSLSCLFHSRGQPRLGSQPLVCWNLSVSRRRSLARWHPAGEAEAGSAGVLPAEEYQADGAEWKKHHQADCAPAMAAT